MLRISSDCRPKKQAQKKPNALTEALGLCLKSNICKSRQGRSFISSMCNQFKVYSY